MTQFALTPQERAVASICTTLCIQWQWPDERETLLGLLRLHLPAVRQGRPLTDLTVAAHQLLNATGTVEWSAATAAAARALVPVLAPDLMAPVMKPEQDRRAR